MDHTVINRRMIAWVFRNPVLALDLKEYVGDGVCLSMGWSDGPESENLYHVTMHSRSSMSDSLGLPISDLLRKTGLYDDPPEPLTDEEELFQQLSRHRQKNTPRVAAHITRSGRKVWTPATYGDGFDNKLLESTTSRIRKRRSARPAPYEFRSHQKIQPCNPSSDSSDGEWPEPARRRISTGKSKLLRQEKRLERISSESRSHHIHQTRRWELEDGRRCRTAFRGRPELVLKQRPHIPKNAPAEEWLSRLEKEGYELEEVR